MVTFERVIKIRYVCQFENQEPDMWDVIAGAIEAFPSVSWLDDSDHAVLIRDDDADL